MNFNDLINLNTTKEKVIFHGATKSAECIVLNLGTTAVKEARIPIRPIVTLQVVETKETFVTKRIDKIELCK